jgi:hypothetical protein
VTFEVNSSPDVKGFHPGGPVRTSFPVFTLIHFHLLGGVVDVVVVVGGGGGGGGWAGSPAGRRKNPHPNRTATSRTTITAGKTHHWRPVVEDPPEVLEAVVDPLVEEDELVADEEELEAEVVDDEELVERDVELLEVEVVVVVEVVIGDWPTVAAAFGLEQGPQGPKVVVEPGAGVGVVSTYSPTIAPGPRLIGPEVLPRIATLGWAGQFPLGGSTGPKFPEATTTEFTLKETMP